MSESTSNIIYGGDVRFPLAIIPTGNQPLDVRTVVQNKPANANEFVDGAVYIGMTISCVADKKYYMLVAKADDGALTWKEIGGAGETAVDLAAAKTMATADSIGKIIQITGVAGTDGNITNESEIGTYVVVGPGVVNKLATTTESGNLVADVTKLQSEVAELQDNVTLIKGETGTHVLDPETGEYREIAEGETGTHVLVNAETGEYREIIKGDIVSLQDAISELSETSATKADWKVKDVDANDKILSLSAAGVLSSSLSYTREEVEGVDSLVLKGKDDEILGSVPVADFIVDGMLQKVEHVGNKLVFTFNTEVEGDDTPTVIEVDLADYIDAYTGDGTTVKVENNVISLINPFTTAHAETLASAVQPGALTEALTPFAKSADVVANTTFNPWKESVDAKLGELEVAIGNAGKVDDVQFDNATIVDNKIANLNNIFATSLDDTETKALSIGLAKDSFLKIEDVVAMDADDINAIINPTQTEPTE